MWRFQFDLYTFSALLGQINMFRRNVGKCIKMPFYYMQVNAIRSSQLSLIYIPLFLQKKSEVIIVPEPTDFWEIFMAASNCRLFCGEKNVVDHQPIAHENK